MTSLLDVGLRATGGEADNRELRHVAEPRWGFGNGSDNIGSGRNRAEVAFVAGGRGDLDVLVDAFNAAAIARSDIVAGLEEAEVDLKVDDRVVGYEPAGGVP